MCVVVKRFERFGERDEFGVRCVCIGISICMEYLEFGGRRFVYV